MRSSSPTIFCVTLCIAFTHVVLAEWGYSGQHGPSHWMEQAPACAGMAQSPVDIVKNDVLIDPNLGMLKFDGYDQTLGGGEFVNNGHTILLSFPPDKTYSMHGGGMGNNMYRALQLHFHWAAPGSNDGSEHTVDGTHYPVEMHIVHIKEPYNTTEQIKDMADGLAVLGVFLEVGAESNPQYQRLFDVAEKCMLSGSTAPLPVGPRLISLLPDSGSFYRYSGSLTTPPCYEAVTWTVLKEPVHITESQLKILQGLKSVTMSQAAKEKAAKPMCNQNDTDCDAPNGADSHGVKNSLGGNYRPTQPLNGRIMTSYLDARYAELQKSHGWTYHDKHTGTPKWPNSYPTCGKDSQSPINFDSSKTQALPGDGAGLTFKGYERQLKGKFVNNGHAVQLDFDGSLKYTIESGGLDSSYSAVQLHFHWGEAFPDRKVDGGSEHTVNNFRYPAEMHIVHGKTSQLSNLTAYRQSNPDAYAVLGVFVKVHEDASEPNSDEGANPDMQKLVEAIQKINYREAEAGFPTGPTLASLLPKDKSFFRYSGSLTTPPCSESVIWTVFSEPIVISVNQFIAFQRLFDIKSDAVSKRTSIKTLKEVSLAKDVAELEKNKNEPSPNETRSKRAVDSMMSASEASGNSAALINGTGKHLLRNNYRPLQALNQRTVHYYSDVGDHTADPSSETDVPETGSPVLLIVLSCIGGIAIFLLFVAIAVKFCCGKEKKNSASYTAGQKEDNFAAM